MLKQKQPRLEFAEVVLVDFGGVAQSSQSDARRIVPGDKECGGVDYLLSRNRHIAIDRTARFSFLVVPIKLCAAQIRKDQRLLNHLRRGGEYRHRCLVLANHISDTVPAPGKIDGDV